MPKKKVSIHTMESGNNDKKPSPPELPADAVRREEMDVIFQQCRADDWDKVLQTVTANPLVGLGQMVMDNHISTTIIHQAITSKGDTDLRAQVVLKILEVTPAAAAIRNGYGSLPLHVIAQRNTKMKADTKEKLIVALVHANVDALAAEGGTGKRTPLHIIFTDYISPGLTKMMINNGARACFMRDKKGWLPAHVACSRHCSPEKLRMLLAVNPAALYELTEDQQSLLDLAKATATKCHPNFALIDELKQQLNRRHSSIPFMPHTPVSSEDSGSATRNRVGSSDSNNSSHPSVADVAGNMGNVAVSFPEHNHSHDHHMESWEQQPPHHPFHPHELDPQHRPMPPLQLPQLQQHQHPQYHHMMGPPPPQPQQQKSLQQPRQQQPQPRQQRSRNQTNGQHSRKRKVTDANAASEALLLLSRDKRDQPAAEGSLDIPSHDMDDNSGDDDDDDDQPTQFADV